MTREEIVSYIRAHLADELELDPARVEEGTRFKEDLEADSLDLYSLVQELEDTYGVRMSDEEAARIKTVGQAVDFVLAETSTKSISGEEASGRGRTSTKSTSGDEASGRGRTSPEAISGEEASGRGTMDREPRP
jgi:acyl carrier protein